MYISDSHVKNTPTLTLHIIAYKCHEGSRNVNTHQKLPEARSWMTTLKKREKSILFQNTFYQTTFQIPGFLLKPILRIELIVLSFTYHHYFYALVSFRKILLLCYILQKKSSGEQRHHILNRWINEFQSLRMVIQFYSGWFCFVPHKQLDEIISEVLSNMRYLFGDFFE